MSNPIVSVLMPIYNTDAPVLKSAIDSILSQTFSNLEYLIINDSPENTKLDRIVESYRDDRIIYLKNDKNLGLEASTNKLIDIAKGKYLAIFDHDDISLSERLQKQVEYLESNPKVGVCSAQFRVFGKENWTSENPIDSNDIKKRLESISCVSHSAAMFRKSVLLENNIRYEKKFFPAASYRIMTRLALVTDMHNLPETLLEYRMGDNNTSLLYGKKRESSRRRIADEYIEARKALIIKELFSFDKVDCIGRSNNHDERRYYKAIKGKDFLFVKSGSHSYENEYNLLKEAYSKDKRYFLEPIKFHNGEVNYLITRWSDESLDLSDYLVKNKVSKEQKGIFIKDLYTISSILRELGIVHRDIIPRNFMVVGGHLSLIDFFWAVKADKYREYDYIEQDIRALSLLGEEYAADIYKWDDAYSFTQVAKYISGKDSVAKEYIAKISKHIGEKVLTPDIEVFRKTIARQEEFNNQLRNENDRLNQVNVALSDENEELRREVDDLKQKSNALTHENKRVVNSLSWRITRPLRVIRRALNTKAQ